MDNLNQSPETNESCCVSYCKTRFQGSGQEIVNTYKCHQKSFSASDMWNIQKSRKPAIIRKPI